jgi:hypothetical protein
LRPKARRQIKESSAELVSTATESIDRGEQLLRNRLLRPLHSMLLASKRDVEQLAERLTQLTTEVRKLTGSGDAPTAKKAAASSKPGSKAAATTSRPAGSRVDRIGRRADDAQRFLSAIPRAPSPPP